MGVALGVDWLLAAPLTGLQQLFQSFLSSLTVSRKVRQIRIEEVVYIRC